MDITAPDQQQALDWLKTLVPSEFEQVLLLYDMPQALLRCEVAQSQQALDVIHYAKSRNELGHLLNLIRQVAPHLTKEIPQPFSNPYKGLATFRAEDAENKLFYGREHETRELLKLLDRQNFIALVGVSGSGKSSAVFAGLIPHLPAQWQVIECRPKDNAFKYLAKALLPLRVDENEREDQFFERLLKELPSGATKLPSLIEIWDSKQRDAVCNRVPNVSNNAETAQNIRGQVTNLHPQLLLIIDQFEELYTLNDAATQHAYLACLLQLIHSDAPAALLLTLRADFIEHALNFPDFAAALNDHTRFISTLKPEELREVIEKPAQQAGLRLEIGLTERILDEVGTDPGRLPLLQFALAQLFEQQEQSQLTLAGYQCIGGVEKALASHADTVLAELRETGLENAVRRILVQLAQPTDSDYTRRVAPRQQLQDDIVQKLATQRLVISSEDSVEIIHESLLRHWQALRDWLNLDREFLLWQSSLRQYLRDQALLRGSTLVIAQEWLAKRGEELQPEEREFIQHSEEKIAQEEAEKRRQQRRWTVFVMLFFVVALGLSGMATWFWQASEQKAQEATEYAKTAADNAKRAEQNQQRAAQKAAEAQEKFTQSIINQSHMLAGFAEIEWNKGNQNLTMRLALEALPDSSESYPDRLFTKAAYELLLRGINHQYRGIFEHDHVVEKVMFSPDGNRFLTISGKYAYIWDIATRQFLYRLQGHESAIYSAAFNLDGKYIVTASKDKTARLWNSYTGNLQALLQGHQSDVVSVVFSHDGKYILTASMDKTARLWNSEKGQLLSVLQGHKSWLLSASFSSDSKHIVTASGDNTARLWDTGNGQLLHTLRGHKSWVTSATFSADNKRVLTSSMDNTARLWSADSGTLLTILQEHTNGVTSAAFSPDGKHIITASWDGYARLWEADSDNLFVTLANGHTYLSTNANGTQRVYLSGFGEASMALNRGMCEVFHVDDNTRHPLTLLQEHKNSVRTAVFSADSQRSITVNKSLVYLWNSDSGYPLTTLRGHKELVTSAVFSADGKYIVTASEDTTARLWNIDSEKLPFTLQIGNTETVATFLGGKRVVISSDADKPDIWTTNPNLDELITYAQKMLPPRDSEHPGDTNISGWRLTCAERKRFFLEEVERCRWSAKP